METSNPKEEGDGRPAWRALTILLLLATALRLCLILAARGDLFAPFLNGIPGSFIREEISRGNVTVELMEGPLLALPDYQYTHFVGGPLFISLAALVPFALMGSNIVALKLIPMLHLVVSVGILFHVLDRWWSRRAAWVGGLLLALSPPAYTQFSVVAWGSHVDSNVLALAGVWAFLALHTPRTDTIEQASPGERLLPRFLFGALLGFSVWYGYQCLVYVAALALLELVLDPRFPVRARAWAQLGGAAVGLLPWWVYNLRYDFVGVRIYGRSFTEHVGVGDESGPGFLARVSELWSSKLPGSVFLPELAGVAGSTWNWIAYGILAVLALAGAIVGLRSVRKRPPTPASVAFAFLLMFTVAYGVSDFQIGDDPEEVRIWRYAMPALLFLIVAAACGADALFRVRSRIPVIGAALLATLFTLGSLQACDFSRFGDDLQTSAVSREAFGRWLAVRFSGHPQMLENIVERASEQRSTEEQAVMYAGMARTLVNLSRPRPGMTAEQQERARTYLSAREFLAERVPEPFRAQFLEDPRRRP